MNPREDILNRVRAAARPAAAAPQWRQQVTRDGLPARFTSALTAAKGEVYPAENLEEAWEVLNQLLVHLQAESIVYNREGPLHDMIPDTRFPQYHWTRASENPHSLRQACLQADVGLTAAGFGLADTGSVGILSGPESSRLVSLLPEVHIAFLDEGQLVPDLISWEQHRPNPLPSQLVLVSGPSKTADIEQTLVVGVHGPKRMMVILYGS